ncbi:MAG TPA: chemotaxis protein CheA [Methylomirabilota bacterium]|nr:chemotaxis protein CheA [Methylomirabilota bacterium]
MSEQIPQEEFQEILREFHSEAQEILAGLEEDMVRLEREPSNRELVNRIFRAMHTLKGNSAFLGFTKMTSVTHEAENVLNKIRNGSLVLTETVMDALLASVDVVKALLREIIAGEDHSVEIDRAVALLQHALNADGSTETEGDAPAMLESSDRGAPDFTEATMIRVEVQRLDHLMNLIGELVIGRNRLHKVRTDIEHRHEGDSLVVDLTQVSGQINLVSSELQEAVMKARMVPIQNIFNRFPRLVRDLAREREKAVDLVVNGHETELDRSLIEKVWDPLVHLIRNAIDHGLESTAERAAAGKPERGQIILAARQEGSHIVISVEDDGRGIDPSRVLAKARRTGLVGQEEALSEQEALNLIFAPGFSTKDEVTDVSGRGVGLDVVKTNLKRLNGLIDVTTVKGVGTRFTLKIPLTLAIVQALLIQVAEEVAAFPLALVVETVRLHPGEVRTINGRPVLRIRDQVLPLLWLHDLFSAARPAERRFNAIIVGLAEERVALAVDTLLGQQEVVVKSIGSYLGEIRGIAGATILGDGRVVMILDVAALIDEAKSALVARR